MLSSIDMYRCDLPFSIYLRLNGQHLGPKFGILEILGGPPPKRETVHHPVQTAVYHPVQFHAATVAEISVTGHIET